MAGVQGNRDSGVSDRGAPIKIGGRASTSAPADVADGARVNAYFDAKGRQVVLIDSASSVDTELPAAAALADDTANPTAPAVAAHGLVWDGAGWDRAPGNTQGAFVQGSVANSAVDDGSNPVKVGGVNRTTRPTYTDGQRAEAHYDTRGAQFVTISATNSVSTVAVANSSVDAASQNTGGLQTNARVQVFNGSTFDRLRGDTTGLDSHLVPKISGGLSVFRSIDLDETEEDVKTSAGQLFGWFVYNSGAAAVYVKIYNATAATVVVGTTTPVMTIPIPAGAAANVEFANGIEFTTAICAAATTGVADSDTGAPAANQCVANLLYK